MAKITQNTFFDFKVTITFRVYWFYGGYNVTRILFRSTCTLYSENIASYFPQWECLHKLIYCINLVQFQVQAQIHKMAHRSTTLRHLGPQNYTAPLTMYLHICANFQPNWRCRCTTKSFPLEILPHGGNNFLGNPTPGAWFPRKSSHPGGTIS